MKPLAQLATAVWLCTVVLPADTPALLKVRDLPSQYQRWLTEEVVYIITAVEKKVFLSLQNDRERDMFVNAFWRQRDPNPNTEENEFKTEHYRRIEYANHWFGKSSPAPGWRSDQGRIYILLGEPQQIQRLENDTEVKPTIIWSYQGKPGSGLPAGFNVVFFKRDAISEYELYTPVKFGPHELIVDYKGDPMDYESAYHYLMNVEPQIAAVSLSLIEGDRSATPSLASELLVRNQIPQLPEKIFKSEYAEKLLKYKEIIEVDYTTTYIESEASLYVLRSADGIDFVHYLIEPKKLTMEHSGSKYYTTLEIYGSVVAADNTIVHQFQRTLPIEMDPARMASISGKLFSFQDMFPLIPGRYRCNILLKNRISKEFTSLEREIEVPARDKPYLTVPVLAHRASRAPSYAGMYKPFLTGDTQLLPSPRNDFVSGDTLTFFCQALNLPQATAADAIVQFTLTRRDQPVLTREKPLRDYPGPLRIVEEFPLQGLGPAYYRLHVAVLGAGRVPLLADDAEFYITPLAALPRPWTASLPIAAGDGPLVLNAIGNEYRAVKQFEAAERHLADAVARDPQSVRFTSDLCLLLLQRNQPGRVAEIVAPLVREGQKPELQALLGQAFQKLGNREGAIAAYGEYVKHFGASLQILNTLGDLLASSGRREEAVAIYRKSLEVNREQPAVKAKLAALGGEAK